MITFTQWLAHRQTLGEGWVGDTFDYLTTPKAVRIQHRMEMLSQKTRDPQLPQEEREAAIAELKRLMDKYPENPGTGAEMARAAYAWRPSPEQVAMARFPAGRNQYSMDDRLPQSRD